MLADNVVVVARWSRSEEVRTNWGDRLNSDLIGRLSGLPVAHFNDVHNWRDRCVFRVIGSGLDTVADNDIVWGMGFIDAGSVPASRDATILAVRGPRSRDRLLELGIECPAIYGDPAILYPLFYRPPVEQEYDVGIIQHCRERGVVPEPVMGTDVKTLSIDIMGGLYDVVQKILSCKLIVSSSLHGVICAHAYGVPAYWLHASDLPMGDGFKFLDYYASIGHAEPEPATVDERGVIRLPAMSPGIAQTVLDPDALLNACPFALDARKSGLIGYRKKLVGQGVKGTIFNPFE